MSVSRRTFLWGCGAIASGSLLAKVMAEEVAAVDRKYHLSISCDALQADPELLDLAHGAGVTDVWLTGFLYGHWYYPLEKMVLWRQRIERQGMATHLINVPLGHPGDSLGSMSGKVPLTPPWHWKLGMRPDGTTYAGTSLHHPATEENCEAMRQIQTAGLRRVFLDDDFRLAQGPGVIGGCFCEKHKEEFLCRTGYTESGWRDLLEAVARRQLKPLLRSWVEWTCDQLTVCFRAQQKAAPDVQLGNMIMYLGAEKAGLRLVDYHDVPFRVGELIFDDGAFAPVKGKTNELFSSLFHRRFAQPELAYSETTAYPADRLSAKNMAAKLAVSTLSDVRNTMYMSGLTAFPKEHWQTLGLAMKRQTNLHRRIAGHVARGPLKHFWGEASRYVGDDNPYSLFLAMGIPFEVTSEPAVDGFTFLSDADAGNMDNLHSPGTVFITRTQSKSPVGHRGMPESLPDLFSLKREILPQLTRVPYVEGEIPVVCAWYPTARAVLLWNLSEKREDLNFHYGSSCFTVSVNELDMVLIEDIGGLG